MGLSYNIDVAKDIAEAHDDIDTDKIVSLTKSVIEDLQKVKGISTETLIKQVLLFDYTSTFGDIE